VLAPAAASPATTGAPAAAAQSAPSSEGELTEDCIRPFEEEEKYLLGRALQATKGNVRRAAQLLGIGRATLYRKIQQYHLRLH
jgi:transcriptional regulator of acetoin/glycerol metabolism